MISTEDEARSWFREVLRIDSIAMRRLETLADLLTSENEKQNLVSRGSVKDLWVRHFVDSAQLLCVSHETSEHTAWLDLGTGAGFPGLVIAICRPDLDMFMVDSRRLRTDWLRSATGELGLSNATVVQSRVEALPPRTFGTISARAFAPLDLLLGLSARFSTSDTYWLLPKGAKAEQELSMLSDRWSHMFHVEQSITDPAAGIVAGRLIGYRTAKSDPTARKGRAE